jgi:D-3-phosphoglycerate dehydrogenase/C-terminal binding protein
MINPETVAMIKPGAYLINTSRGPVCDTAALLEGLKSDRLLAVGLDVLPREPGQADDPLVAAWRANEPWIRGRVLLNPHAAFYSPDAYVDQRTKAVQTAFNYLRDGTLVNCVNAEYLKQRR